MVFLFYFIEPSGLVSVNKVVGKKWGGIATHRDANYLSKQLITKFEVAVIKEEFYGSQDLIQVIFDECVGVTRPASNTKPGDRNRSPGSTSEYELDNT